MILNPESLKKAEAAAADLREAQRQADLARAEYHTAIRRLHLAGGSLREIAAALGMSHQRVQQIVDEAGGTWWQRIWRTRQPKRDAVCTFCGRPPSEVSKLIAGPNVYICDACTEEAEQVLSQKPPASGTLTVARKGARDKCSFCGKRQQVTRPVVSGRTASVCSVCLTLCRQILADRRSNSVTGGSAVAPSRSWQ